MILVEQEKLNRVAYVKLYFMVFETNNGCTMNNDRYQMDASGMIPASVQVMSSNKLYSESWMPNSQGLRSTSTNYNHNIQPNTQLN